MVREREEFVLINGAFVEAARAMEAKKERRRNKGKKADIVRRWSSLPETGASPCPDGTVRNRAPDAATSKNHDFANMKNSGRKRKATGGDDR